ncbi:MAG: B12-binding domain-containing radical SAM protein [Terriglobales bacterium]
MAHETRGREKFLVEIIKPSHYYDNGYVIQWLRAFIPSNSLACLYALVHAAGEKSVLGDHVEVVINAYDESNTVVPVRKIIRRIQAAAGRGVVFLAGVQSNQLPRAADMAHEFREAGIAVVLGGFHVSGCLGMLPDLPDELRALLEQGVALFAGEAEGQMDQLLIDAYRGQLQPVYNFLKDLPDLRGQQMPFLPPEAVRRAFSTVTFDAGRGCPFQCSFCTIINVQGRKYRYRDAAEVERLVRTNLAQGNQRFFITDDDFARNKNWEAIFDRLIALREDEGWIGLRLTIQVDTQCHKIPRFIEKAVRAGCTRVFIGLESVNPENLAASRKNHNHVHEYRTMLQAWRSREVLTLAGYIVGFPADTPASIERDIKTIQRELPVDILEFFMLTPLPGSADHKELYSQGKWMDPDLNRYDSEHAAAKHARMNAVEWQAIYHRAWHLYYSREHVATLLRRARAGGTRTRRLASAIFTYYGSYRFEHVHPLQSGVFRRKVRRTRRPGMPRENPLLFYSRRIWEIVTNYGKAAAYYLWLNRLRKSIERAPDASTYTDAALTVPAGQAVNRDGSRVVTTILDDDPLRATDPAAWWLAFKVNRARRNEDALALLTHETRRGRTKLATVEREAQEGVSCVQAMVPVTADRCIPTELGNRRAIGTHPPE